jgi:hypothetical protein
MSFSRRRFLRGAAGATLALPFLPSMTAQAGPATFPTRVVFVYAPQQESERFLPAGSGSSFTLDGTYLDPLAPYQDRLTIMHNMTAQGGHSAGHSDVFTGFAWGWDDTDMDDHWTPRGGPSLDQYIASRIGTVTPLGALGLTISDYGNGRDDNETSWRRLPDAGEETLSVLPSRRGSVVSIPHVRSPSEGYSMVFGTGGGTPMIDRQTLLRRSLIDAVLDDTNRVRATLALADQRVLDSHLTQLRDYERRLAGATPFTCDAGFGRPAAGDLDRPTSAPIHLDTIVGAFRCDASRVATFTFGASGDGEAYRWCSGVTNFHEVVHSNADYTSDPPGDHAAVRRWQVQQIRYLCDQLAAVPEGDGTLLDHTLIVWCCELGLWTFGTEGNDHSRANVPALLIGNAGGAFRTGRIFDAGGAHFHRMHLSILHALGYTDVAQWGDEGSSTISGLFA